VGFFDSGLSANRVYESGTHRFHAAGGDGRVLDEADRSWIVEEGQLRTTAQHPETLLIT